jgi:hypothetical protein
MLACRVARSVRECYDIGMMMIRTLNIASVFFLSA